MVGEGPATVRARERQGRSAIVWGHSMGPYGHGRWTHWRVGGLAHGQLAVVLTGCGPDWPILRLLQTIRQSQPHGPFYSLAQTGIFTTRQLYIFFFGRRGDVSEDREICVEELPKMPVCLCVRERRVRPISPSALQPQARARTARRSRCSVARVAPIARVARIARSD